MENTEDLVNVIVRIKPLTKDDSTRNNVKIISYDPPVLCVSDRHNFNFDQIFNGSADQTEVFDNVVKPMIHKFLLGFNCTVFAYGQTGSGKTYTMGNPQNVDEVNMGMMDRTFKEIFNNFNPNVEIDTEISFYEIYNEKVFDLLNVERIPLSIQNFSVPALKKCPVSNLTEAQFLFSSASKNRRTADTAQNSKSSRSHAIYTIHCTMRSEEGVKTSKFNFIDLAGSESVKKTASDGTTFHEGVNINKGLLCLGQVINAISSNQNYIPYRQAVITTILRDSLSKKNYITLIACVSPNLSDTSETLQTLDFARRVKKVSNRPEANPTINDSYRKRLLTDAAKFRTPAKPLHPMKTSTAFKNPKSRSIVGLCTPATPMHHSTVLRLGGETIESISPIVRMCVEQLEAKLTSTVSSLVNAETRRLLRRSSRLSTLRGTYNKISAQSVNGNSPIQKARVQAAIKPFSDVTNRSENVSNNSDGASMPLEDLPELTARFRSRKTKRLYPKQVMSTPNVSIQYEDFVENFTHGDGTLGEVQLPVQTVRRSDRLFLKSIRNSRIDDTQKLVPTTSKSEVKRKINEESSPPVKKIKISKKVQKYHNHVLETLNKGDLKSLMSLHTIGVKTAEKIILYRELRGKFESINDTKNVLVRGTSFKRFLDANLLS